VRVWTSTILKLVWGAYWLLTVLYCLLCFLPYTYYALIKAPVYDWMPWFVHHHAALFWPALVAAAIAYWPERRARWYLVVFGAQVLTGAYIWLFPFMPALGNNQAAYVWGLIALGQVLLVTVAEATFSVSAPGAAAEVSTLAYSGAILAATAIALLYSAGAHLRSMVETHVWNFHFGDVELVGWSVLSHMLVAILILTALNLIRLASAKASRPGTVRRLLTGGAIVAGLTMGLLRFLENALSFQGWQAQLFAVAFAAALTLLGFSLAVPLRSLRANGANPGRRKIVLIATIVILAAIAVALPSLIAGGDWNGVIQSTFALLFWMTISGCLYSVWPKGAKTSVGTILVILLIAGFAYKGLQATEIFWARPLGSTDDEVSRSMENYAAQDVSFELAHHLLGNARIEPCADLCRILREYTNIRNAPQTADLNLVDPLTPVHGERPNIFIFIIDSLRPDYLGAYNPRVDFTPNLDAFARESIAVKNVYTQYAGTTLSEPAIWSGTMLLHTHYLQPFSRINGLEKLAKADGYQMVVSYDTVLSQLLSPSDDLIKVDEGKLWNQFEVCETVQATENALDARQDKSRPVLFYAQPMNVHQFAKNHLPRISSENWRSRPGFNDRIAYEVQTVDQCVGQFVGYLKTRGMYDNSIVVLASDHGDATGQFGRFSHSVKIYPEIMRVPLLVHLPKAMRGRLVYDDSRVSVLTDITPSLYYLLGHKPVVDNPMFGRPLFVEKKEELARYPRREFFLASDVHAVYGILADNGRYLYVAYDSPADGQLYDLANDPNAEHNILTAALKKHYDERIIEHLHEVADFYGYRPGVGSMLAAK
jgi:arylsulfatase A-like enzyme